MSSSSIHAMGWNMQNRALESELRELADQLKGHFREEIKQRVLRRNVCFPLTNSLTIRSTLRFFSSWLNFASALYFMSPSLPKRLEKMQSAAEDLSGKLDCYDSGDRGPETYAAYRFLRKLEDVQKMIKEMPI